MFKIVSLFFRSKKNIFQKSFFPILLCLTTTISFAQSSSCNAILEVEKNRNYNNTNEDGAYFKLELTNKGNSTDIYNLSAQNINASCSNNDKSSTSENVNLISSLLDSNSEPITSITVLPNQKVVFLIHLVVPQGTKFNKWNCTQINAISSNCTNYKVNTVVHTIVNNPSEN